MFSEGSYIPRSGRVNISLNVFGESVNFFEAGIRGENFEDVAEDLFGPNGKWTRVSSFLDFFKKSVNDSKIFEPTKDSLFAPMKYHRLREPRGNYFLRLFGKDIDYKSFQGITSLSSIVSPNFVTKYLNNLKISKSSIFLDGGISLPTLAGMALKFQVNGSYVMDLKLNQTADYTDMFSIGNAKGKLKFAPSLEIELTGQMSVAGKNARVGMKSKNTLKTESYIEAQISLDTARKLKVTFHTPHKILEVFKVSGEFFRFQDDKFEQLKSSHPRQSMQVCSGQVIQDIFKSKMCGTLQYHESPDLGYGKHLLYAGSYEASFVIEKQGMYQWFQVVMETDALLNKLWGISNWAKRGKNFPHTNSYHLKLGTSNTVITDMLYHTYFYAGWDTKRERNLLNIKLPTQNFEIKLQFDWLYDLKYMEIQLSQKDYVYLSWKTQLASVHWPQKLLASSKLTILNEEIYDIKLRIFNTVSKSQFNFDVESTFHEDMNFEGKF